jgi:YVTN family beta-propeller protein
MRLPRMSAVILRTLFTLGAFTLVILTATLTFSDDEGVVTTVKPALTGNRGPYEVAFTPDGERAVVTEFDEGAVAIIDRASGTVLRHVSTGGDQPTGVAVTPDGAVAVVTNSLSGSVAFVDLRVFKTATLPLRGMPWDVVLAPDGTRAYVSVSQLDHVAVLDVARREVIGTIPTGRRPRALAITPDGRTVAVANMMAGSVSFLDTVSMRETATGPTPAVNLRGVAVYPNGRRAFAVAQRAQNERPTESAIGIWSNQAFHLVPNGGRNGAENLWLDFMGKDVADPDSVVFDPEVRRAFITCSGGHSLNVVGLRGGTETQTVRGIGAHPRGLAFTPDGRELWVANLLGNDLAVVDPQSLRVVRRIGLGSTPRRDPHLLGRFLFTSATIVKGAQFSCNSCHPDGNTDGISWKFVHVPDALGSKTDRNVKGLRGRLSDTLPFRWSGHDRSAEVFIQEEVTGLLQGPKLTRAEIRSLFGYLDSLPLPPNPHRAPDGSLTSSARRGQLLFVGRAGCTGCHSGPKAGSQRTAWVGTTPAEISLNVPHLAGVYDTDPYLHDGRARTLEEIFERHNTAGVHGKSQDLSDAELKDLFDYVRQL